MREVEAGGWVDGPTFDRYDAMKDVKHLDYFLNSKQRLYYLFFIRDGKKQLLLMEPSQEMVDMMTKYSKVQSRCDKTESSAVRMVGALFRQAVTSVIFTFFVLIADLGQLPQTQSL